MSYSDGGYSLADISAATGGNRNNDGFGDGSWAWILVFLIFALGGFGNNGWGNRGGSSGSTGGVADGYILATDFANIERKIDGVNNGLCDGFYAMAQQFSNTNQNIANSTASLQNTLCQGFNGLNVAYLQGTNNLSTQLASCCCNLEKNQMETNYLNAQNTCAITTGANNNTRDIIDAINNSYNNLHNEIVTNRMEDLKEANRALTARNTSLELAASQERQNNYLISQLNPTPIPAFQVANPNCCYNTCGCGC